MLIVHSACANVTNTIATQQAYQVVKKITYNNVSVEIVIDKPINDTLDIIIAYHGTVFLDSKILEAAQTTLSRIKEITARKNMMIVSVAYPEEGLLMGDNVRESEAALLWVKNQAAKELGIRIQKIFLVGHSQGGYIVTRLSSMHATNGIVANAPGPLNLALRCQFEDSGQIPGSVTCALMRRQYGTVASNAEAYNVRSLLYFTSNFMSDMLFIQGLDDAQIQLTSWPIFVQQVRNCTNCQSRLFLDVPQYGHTALFDSPQARQLYNEFLNR
ncbi:MAG: alpha/beta hydrolase fold domain-containing protein [Candidatus Kapabacteria bacterium]|nr:alpha/beta hydrolase fold domain-containing protein [Candidatus Kapabacteria bacterium]